MVVGMRARTTAAWLVTLVACATDPAPHEPAPREPPAPHAPARPVAAEASTTAPVRHDVAVDGHTLAVWSKTPADPRGAFLLVHGRTWSALPDFDLQVPGEQRSLMDALVAHGWAAHAVDLRGYGGTPRDATGWLTPDRAAKDVAAILDWAAARTPGNKPVLFGWSMGSLVSQLCAQRHPDRIAALVLFGYPRPARWTVPEKADPAEPPRKPTTREAAAEDFIVPGTISQAAISAYVEAAVTADPVRADWARMHEFNELDAAKVTVPTLVIHGDHDPYAPTEKQAELVELLGASRKQLVTLEGLDHAAHLEDLGRFVDAVLAFVAGG